MMFIKELYESNRTRDFISKKVDPNVIWDHAHRIGLAQAERCGTWESEYRRLKYRICFEDHTHEVDDLTDVEQKFLDFLKQEDIGYVDGVTGGRLLTFYDAMNMSPVNGYQAEETLIAFCDALHTYGIRCGTILVGKKN